MEKIKEVLKTTDYDFLRENPFGENIIMLCVSGSRSYGTNLPSSDIDIRGVSLDLADDLLLLKKSRNFSNNNTDTVIYQFNSFLNLLSNGSPNAIQLLGLKPEHYLYTTVLWNEILKNKEAFISKKCLFAVNGFLNGIKKELLKETNFNKRSKEYSLLIQFLAYGCDLANGEVKTHREKERELLLDIKLGKYLRENGEPTIELSDILNEFEKKFEKEINNSKLPDKPNFEKIDELRKKVNREIILKG